MTTQLPKSKNQKRKLLKVYLTQDELDNLKKDSQYHDASLSKIAHLRITKPNNITDFFDPTELLSELKDIRKYLLNIANNINQIAKKVNTTHVYSQELHKEVNELMDTVKHISDVMKVINF
jgi:methyl-accepting chemotaxis protein